MDGRRTFQRNWTARLLKALGGFCYIAQRVLENAMKNILLASVGVFLAASAAQADVGSSALVKWGPAPSSLPKGARAVVLSGDPTKAGLFTMRLKFPPGYTVAPHHHPADELTTVLAGELSRGVGDTIDRAKATHFTVGG